MPSKYHNLSNEALADEIGRAEAIVKAAEAELKALKDDFKARGLKHAAGEYYVSSVRGRRPDSACRGHAQLDDRVGCSALFWGRVGYLALYAAGVFLLRSLAWNVAALGIVLVLLSLV